MSLVLFIPQINQFTAFLLDPRSDCLCLSLSVFFVSTSLHYSLSAGNDNDICCDAAVRDGPTCPTLPGAIHPDNLRRGGWVQGRDEAVLGRNNL